MEIYAGWWEILILVLLAIVSATFNQYQLGILSLDIQYLELVAKGPYETKEDEKEAKLAKRVLPLRRRGNLLLCTI